MVFFIGGKMFKKKNKELTEEEKEVIRTKSFFDMILPSTIKFSTDIMYAVTVTDVYGQSRNIRLLRKNLLCFLLLRTETI